jgi:tetratricopeptide (TPR) repeat protein
LLISNKNLLQEKKISEAERKIEELEEKIKEIDLEIENKKNSGIPNLKESSDIKTLHQALDLFIQSNNKLDHKTSQEEFEELEKIGSELFEKIFLRHKEKINAIPVLKDKSIISLFERILASEKLPKSIIDEINSIRRDKTNYKFYDRSVIVSSITLSILSWKVFDPSKIDILIDFLTDFESKVWERALTGGILSLIVHQNRLKRYPNLIKRLQTLQELEKVQIGVYIIDRILRNQLFKNVFFPKEFEKDEFLNETPYNWFFPFYKENKILVDTIDNVKQDIELDRLVDFLIAVPFVSAVKYNLCIALRNNRIQIEYRETEKGKLEKHQKHLSIVNNSLNLAYYYEPYYNYIAEFYLYYKFFPKERILKLFNSKITLAQTKLKNIILNKIQTLKLVADLHFENKEFNACISKLKELLNIEPNQLSALQQIAQCFKEKSDFASALNYYLQFEKYMPNNSSNLFEIGLCLNRTKQFKKSNEYLYQAKEINQEDERIISLIGDNYYELNEYDKSIEYNKKVIDLDKNNTGAIGQISDCYTMLHKPEEALKYSLRLYEIDSEEPLYIMAVANDYRDLERYDEALELAEKAFLIDSNNPHIVFSYGRILFESDNFTKAKIILQKVLGLKKANKRDRRLTHGNLGHIYFFGNNLAKSQDNYEKCVLLFDDIKDFEEKFNADIKHAIRHNISKEEYENKKLELISFWQENN